jgi:RNA polymerase sigma-70 factor, ECF subfamily
VQDMAEVLADPAPDATAVIAGRQRLAQVRGAIAILPERQRMAIMLSAVAGLDVPEIGQAMGASAGAVEQLLVRARRQLRHAVGDDNAG